MLAFAGVFEMDMTSVSKGSPVDSPPADFVIGNRPQLGEVPFGLKDWCHGKRGEFDSSDDMYRPENYQTLPEK